MRNKGRIKTGADADLVIFDPNRIIDKATFENTAQYSDGNPTRNGEWTQRNQLLLPCVDIQNTRKTFPRFARVALAFTPAPVAGKYYLGILDSRAKGFLRQSVTDDSFALLAVQGVRCQTFARSNPLQVLKFVARSFFPVIIDRRLNARSRRSGYISVVTSTPCLRAPSIISRQVPVKRPATLVMWTTCRDAPVTGGIGDDLLKRRNRAAIRFVGDRAAHIHEHRHTTVSGQLEKAQNLLTRRGRHVCDIEADADGSVL
jgi:hypothetical protein